MNVTHSAIPFTSIECTVNDRVILRPNNPAIILIHVIETMQFLSFSLSLFLTIYSDIIKTNNIKKYITFSHLGNLRKKRINYR